MSRSAWLAREAFNTDIGTSKRGEVDGLPLDVGPECQWGVPGLDDHLGSLDSWSANARSSTCRSSVEFCAAWACSLLATLRIRHSGGIRGLLGYIATEFLRTAHLRSKEPGRILNEKNDTGLQAGAIRIFYTFILAGKLSNLLLYINVFGLTSK